MSNINLCACHIIQQSHLDPAACSYISPYNEEKEGWGVLTEGLSESMHPMWNMSRELVTDKWDWHLKTFIQRLCTFLTDFVNKGQIRRMSMPRQSLLTGESWNWIKLHTVLHTLHNARNLTITLYIIYIPLWKHSSVCSFVFKENTIQQLSEIHAVWSDYSLIYKISFLEEKQTFNRD